MSLDPASSREQASIMLACNEAVGLREGAIGVESLGRAKAYWSQIRDQSAMLAEQTAVLAWNKLIEGAADPLAVDELIRACEASGY